MALPFDPSADLIVTRAHLQKLVGEVLDRLRSGVLPDDAERQQVDCKEEAGRRGAGGILLPGDPHNLAAADQLSSEVACLANTPGGGALIVGVEDKTGRLLGAALDAEWLRHRVYERVGVAPAVETFHVDGIRLLVVYVAEAREPVEDIKDRIRWRTGGYCAPVDRAEWWLHREAAQGHDPMAVATDRTVEDVSDGAVLAARRFLRPDSSESDLPASTRALLSSLGVLRPDGHLTQAGALVFCASNTTHLSVTVLDVEGGDILSAPRDLAGFSLLEQVALVEDQLDGLNTSVSITGGGFAARSVRRLPQGAVREAVLNGVVHRDWMQADTVAITWVEADSALQVVSPGGLVGGMTVDNVLTQRYARYPALADLFRALRLVEKQGLGVDRMYREMVSLGHRPPVLVEEPGPRVRVRLSGGVPVLPVLDLMGRIRPTIRQRDVRVALIVHTLLHAPFVTSRSLVKVLQRSEAECDEALATTAECIIDDEPLLRTHRDSWVLSPSAIHVVEAAAGRSDRPARGILPYRRPETAENVARTWLKYHDRFTSGDHAALTGLTQPGALKQLERLERAGLLLRGDGTGRNSHFIAGPALGS
jgi:ATP-dependent DNA helicase RecG